MVRLTPCSNDSMQGEAPDNKTAPKGPLCIGEQPLVL